MPLQKYHDSSVWQWSAYPLTIYGSVLAAFVTSLLIGFLLRVQRYTVSFYSPSRLCPLAATGGELAVTGRTARLMLQYRFLPTDGRRNCGKNRHPLYTNHSPYYICKAQCPISPKCSKTTQNTLKTQPIQDMHLAEYRNNHALQNYFAPDNRSAVYTLTILVT